jgi:hypothetical protein
MTWDSNWVSSEGKGKLLKVGLNNLRGAINQRMEGANLTLSGSVTTISSGELIPSSWFSAFQSEINRLFDNYINHNDNGGNWDGIAPASAAPLWTEASMLTQIGAASRVAAPTDPLISASWMYQQYKIINQLRWRREYRTGFSGSNGAYRTANILAADTPAQRLTKWNAATWNSESGDTPKARYDDPGASGSGFIQRKRYTLSLSSLDTWAGGYLADVDWYVQATITAGGDVYNPAVYTQNVYNLETSYNDMASGDGVSREFGNISTIPANQYGQIYSWDLQGGLNKLFVLKYDGNGGFTYKDW